jgi:hypothetical protein
MKEGDKDGEGDEVKVGGGGLRRKDHQEERE